MINLRILFLILLFIHLSIACTKAESVQDYNIEFQASQSYELSDLVDFIISLKTSTSFGSIKESNKLEYAYKIDPKYLYVINSENIRPYRHFGGKVGILLNGIGHEKLIQKWEDGLLINNYIPMGDTWDIVFVCPVVYAFDSVQLRTQISPVLLNNKVDPNKSGNFNIEKYFSENNYKVLELSKEGNFNFNKTLLELRNSITNKTIYMISRFSSGASGEFGSTTLVFYYDFKSAQKYYDTVSP